MLFAGFAIGLIFYRKALEQPDYNYEITIKKLKSKGNVGENSGIIPHIDLNIEDEETGEKKQKKGLFRRFLNKDKK